MARLTDGGWSKSGRQEISEVPPRRKLTASSMPMAAMAVRVMTDCTRLPARTPRQLMAVSKASAAAAMPALWGNGWPEISVSLIEMETEEGHLCFNAGEYTLFIESAMERARLVVPYARAGT